MKIFFIFCLLFFKLFFSLLFAQQWECEKCETINEASYNFCYICGAAKPSPLKEDLLLEKAGEIEKTVECLKCGHIYAETLPYCPECNVQNYSLTPENAKEITDTPILKSEPEKKSLPKKLFKDVNRHNYLLLSTFSPGLGQYLLNKKVKGISFTILTYGSILYGYYNKMQADKEYKNIKGITLTKDNYEHYFYYKDRVKDYDSEAKKFYTIAAIIWLYNLFDTNYTFNEYKLEQRRLQIQFTPSSASVTKRF
jgi:predicted  nucleic acid-binding Zn-ribbon protein